MANFKTSIERSRRNGSLIVRYRDGKTKTKTGRWKKFSVRPTIMKTDRVFVDGKWKTAQWIAEQLAEKTMRQYLNGELGIVDSSEPVEDLIEEYIDDKKDLAWKTLDHYRCSLAKLEKRFPSLEHLTKENMGIWRDELAKKYANNSVHGFLNDSRMFCNWLVYKKKISSSPFRRDNPQERVIIPAQTESIARFYTIDEFAKIEKELAFLDPYVRIGARLGHDCGLRKVEIVGDGKVRLQGAGWEDLIWHPDGKVALKVRITKGKKTKTRIVGVPSPLVELLGSRKTGPLCPVTRDHFDTTFEKAIALAKVEKIPQRFIHALRHSLGKNLLQLSGGNQKALRDIYGHKSVKTTEIYSHLEQSYRDQAIEVTAQKVEAEKARLLNAGQNNDIKFEIKG